MPTPFMHLVAAQRLVDDPALPSGQAASLARFWGPFLLGNISPDAHHLADRSREDTHFFVYRPKVEPPAIDALLAAYPGLGKTLAEPAQRAFMAGYMAHLAMDEVWCEELLFPDFVYGEWGTRESRFFILHVLLGFLDARDYLRLLPTHYTNLSVAIPDHWLPFLPDQALVGWRDLVADQIRPGGASQTLEILGRRVPQGLEGLHNVLDSPGRLDAELWSNVPPETLAAVEEAMYRRMRRTVTAYLDES